MCRSGKDPRFAPLPRTKADPKAAAQERSIAAKRYAFVYDQVMAQDRSALQAELKVGPGQQWREG
jgi:hypothetical protein